MYLLYFVYRCTVIKISDGSESDYNHLNIPSLLPHAVTGLEPSGWRERDPPAYSVIILHLLQNGLVRVRLRAHKNKLWTAGRMDFFIIYFLEMILFTPFRWNFLSIRYSAF